LKTDLVDNFKNLEADEKWLLSAIFLSGRQLHRSLAQKVLQVLASHRLIKSTPPAKQIRQMIDGLEQKQLINCYDQIIVLDIEITPMLFIFPLENGGADKLIKCVEELQRKLTGNYYYYQRCFAVSISELQQQALNLYLGKVAPERIGNPELNYGFGDMHPRQLALHFSEDWFAELPEISQILIFSNFYQYHLHSFTFDNAQTFEIYNYFLTNDWRDSPVFCRYAAHFIAEFLIFLGRFDDARGCLEDFSGPENEGLQALLTYIEQGTEEAIPRFHKAFASLKKSTRKRNISFQTLAAPFYALALLQEGSPESIKCAIDVINKAEKSENRYSLCFVALNIYSNHKTTGSNKTNLFKFFSHSGYGAIGVWFGFLVGSLMGNKPANEHFTMLHNAAYASASHGFTWLANECHELQKFNGGDEEAQLVLYLKNAGRKLPPPLVKRICIKEEWETLLDAVETAIVTKADVNDSDKRLVWVVAKFYDDWHLHALEQKKLKSGAWSKGKQVLNHNRNYDKEVFPEYYSETDIRVMKIFENLYFDYESQFDRALYMLAGQSNVYCNNTNQQIEIVRAEPELILKTEGGKLKIEWFPKPMFEEYLAEIKPPDQAIVYRFPQAHLELTEMLKQGTTFPLNASDRLHQVLSRLESKIKVRSDFRRKSGEPGLKTTKPKYQIHVRLAPVEHGLGASVRLSLFPGSAGVFIPGSGLQDAIVDCEGEKLHVERQLDTEQALAKELLEKCPSMQGIDSSSFHADFPDPAAAYQLLFELQHVEDLVLEWPENYKPKKIRTADFNDFKFKISSGQDWFSVDGELDIDEELVLGLQQLLRQYDGKSRFVVIDQTRILAISDDFRRRISDLASYTAQTKSGRRFARAVIPAIDALISDSKALSADKEWQRSIESINSVSQLSFAVPATFTAELREYQREGFVWLSRLAAMGMGACLADDMGLGKTVQALALILSKAAQGPTLIVAPTSVCANWVQEARKFAATLNPILLSFAPDRAAVIKKAKPYDLLICSYGIMGNEIDKLEKLCWQTVVLDEAQSIKNTHTSRSKSAMRLKGKFKMIMTGTPVENHLGELWNLFNFINPGLLGDLETFNCNFAVPIQQHDDRQAQGRLKRLVHPFVLRRTKSQVLLDLPVKTEITLHVDLSEDERALYESIRREAIEKISNCKKTARPMQILAEITRLRRMCCNPSLVAPELGISGSKLELFGKIIDELAENNHKALVFSQFVDQLALVRKMIEAKGLGYQYLDGSTPAKKRSEAVAAFQNGDERLFLISLKAGGLGLNLTAADYVIHLDPWWNPAVEDQASDRAHRIGQIRPVTVYRLITTATIEERIVTLHEKKRELADSLLSGSDMSARISTEDLLTLILNSGSAQEEEASHGVAKAQRTRMKRLLRRAKPSSQ
jgi:superfamily II DNA or RNA helicase